VSVVEDAHQVESWFFYEQMARRGEYGEGDIVSDAGEIVLSPELKMEAEFFIEHLGGRAAVLDVGSGLGFPSLVLAPHVARLIALDAAPTMVARLHAQARRLGQSNLRVVRARAEAMPFQGGRFDGAAICGTLGSVTQPQQVLAELCRAMTPGGVVACIAENFADKLVLDEGKVFRRFRMSDGELVHQETTYLRRPYRIRDCRCVIRRDSEIYQRLAAEHGDAGPWREATELTGSDLPRGAVAEVLCEEVLQFDPATLTRAFARSGFKRRTIELRRHFPVEHIFASFEKR
jgi:SAM-dependent methyltransferase